MKIKFDVLNSIKNLAPKYVLIVSNQGGIEKGFVDVLYFQSKLQYIGLSIREYIKNNEVYSSFCIYNSENCHERKPNTGMLEFLTEKFVGDDFEYIKSNSLMIGDASGLSGQFSDTDKKTAENFGIDYLDVNDFIKLYK